MVTLTHHKKSIRSLAIHPTEYSFASGSAGGNNIKKWKCPEGTFVFNFSGHNAIINTLSVNAEGVFFSGGEAPRALFHYRSCLLTYIFPQATMVLSRSGTITRALLFRTWTTFLNLGPWKQKLVFSVRPLI